MRPSENNRRPGSPADTEPTSGQPDPGARNGSDDLARLLEAMESALSAVHERVSRLEGDVRNLQSQNANRS